MFALRSAVALTCLIAAAGRRHTDSHLTPEVGQAEEKTAEALESITPHGGDGHLIPLSASFQVAPTMGDMPVKTKFTLLMSHVSTAASELGIVCQLTATDEASATHFAQALTEYYAFFTEFYNYSVPVTFEFSAPGRQVLIKVKGFPKEATQHFVAAVEAFASNLGHVNASVDLDVDMREIMAHLSNDTVLYEELYKGFRYSVDASLSKALENLLASRMPDTAPGAPFSGKAMARKLFSLFTGASADVKVAFDESVRQDLIRSIPFVNMSYGTLVSLYRPLVSMYPAMLRGTDIALKSLNIILAMENIETLDTMEITGLPGLQLMAVGNTTSGSFEFLSKLAKDAGLVEVLRNTSTEFPPVYPAIPDTTTTPVPGWWSSTTRTPAASNSGGWWSSTTRPLGWWSSTPVPGWWSYSTRPPAASNSGGWWSSTTRPLGWWSSTSNTGWWSYSTRPPAASNSGGWWSSTTNTGGWWSSTTGTPMPW